MKKLTPIEHTLKGLAAGELRSSDLVNSCLHAIEEPRGREPNLHPHLLRSARAAAGQFDPHRAAGPLGGLPVSIKDLFDVAGERTTAGSVVLADAPPANADALAVARLRAAGAILMGKTNMTEFAYSGLGLNPHYGTPCNPYDRPGNGFRADLPQVRRYRLLTAWRMQRSVQIPAGRCAFPLLSAASPVSNRPRGGFRSREHCPFLSPLIRSVPSRPRLPAAPASMQFWPAPICRRYAPRSERAASRGLARLCDGGDRSVSQRGIFFAALELHHGVERR